MIKVLYAGSPEASAILLEKLIEKSGEDYKIAGVLTNPPSRQGRHKALVQTPVAFCAEKYNIPVFAPETLDAEFRSGIAELNADILVCFAYKRIFGPKFMSLFRFKGMNLHPSDLPKYRGCTPIQSALKDMEKELCVSVQTIAQKMDEGEILGQKKILFDSDEMIEFLDKQEVPDFEKNANPSIAKFNRLNINTKNLLVLTAEEGVKIIDSLLTSISKTGKIPEGKAQSGTVSYTKMILKDDAKIDWSEEADKIAAKIAACYDDPAAWTSFNGEKLKILKAHKISCTDEKFCKSDECFGKVIANDKDEGLLVRAKNGIVCITLLQKSGKQAMDNNTFLNGARNFIGSVLG